MTFVNAAQQGGFEVNPREIMRQTPHDPFSANTKFDSILGAAGGMMQMFGPVGGLLAQRFGGNMGAAVTSSVLSGFAGSGGVSAPGFGGGGGAGGFNAMTSTGASYGPGKSLAMPGAPPGYPGAGGGGVPGAPPGFPGGGGGGGMNMNAGADVGQFDSQINSMMNNNLLFLGIQTKVQNVSQTTQLMSNIFKADSDAKLNAIRNVRS